MKGAFTRLAEECVLNDCSTSWNRRRTLKKERLAIDSHFFLKAFVVTRAFENPIYWNAERDDFKVFCASLIHAKTKITSSKQAIMFASHDHREYIRVVFSTILESILMGSPAQV